MTIPRVLREAKKAGFAPVVSTYRIDNAEPWSRSTWRLTNDEDGFYLQSWEDGTGTRWSVVDGSEALVESDDAPGAILRGVLV